jgi:hypothetical protein
VLSALPACAAVTSGSSYREPVSPRRISTITALGATDKLRRELLDLKIKGRKAIVCAASKGLRRACAMSLGRAGVDLVITARTRDTLEATAENIRTADHHRADWGAHSARQSNRSSFCALVLRD